MRALLRVEVRRFLARRLFKVTTILVIVLLAVTGVTTFFASRTTPEEVARARVEREAMFQNCVESQGFGAAPEEREDLERFCREEMVFSAGDPRFDYSQMTENLKGLAIPFLMLGWIVGASFIGAEWHNRMLTMTLTWEPRRIRLVVAKAAALALCVALWILLLQALFSAFTYPAAAVHGITDGVDATFWRELGAIAVRVDVLAVLASLLGFALATIGRSTAAALGVGFAYLTVVEGVIRGFKPEWSDWLVGDNIALFLVGNQSSPLSHDQTAAGWLLLAYTAALLMLAAASFKRREMS